MAKLNSEKEPVEAVDVTIDYPKQEVIERYPALEVAMAEKHEVEKREDECSGDRDVCSDLEWGDYSAKS